MPSKTKLSAAVLGLVLAGASAPAILDQFLNENKGNSLTAYKDGSVAVAPRRWMENWFARA